ncbi:IS3 family transposase [Paraglaciecola chathamensis S18K6]|uniref:IS3 family transposase n=1 Tax=Paraglaciecola chathamensis S18K6 TaxID=1127672 RepID=A0AAV3V5K5_9ALTE|nr:IS3 family transposase [Paraglaciecola chathamensis S18K6]
MWQKNLSISTAYRRYIVIFVSITVQTQNKKYPDEFKQETVRQVIEKGHSVPDVAKRLGISDKSLYYWICKAKAPLSQSTEQEEIRKLKAELKRVTEERNILKEAAVYFASESKKSTRS